MPDVSADVERRITGLEQEAGGLERRLSEVERGAAVRNEQIARHDRDFLRIVETMDRHHREATQDRKELGAEMQSQIRSLGVRLGGYSTVIAGIAGLVITVVKL